LGNVALRNEIKPFYFGTSPKKLFGCHHLRRKFDANARPPVVVCSPVGQEYIRAHRALYQLAISLAGAGHDVLRFDYYGCGDSSGEFEEGSLQQWTSDIEAAVEEIKRTTAKARVCLVGLRLGAVLAARAAAGRSDIAGVALWEPVFNGKGYLQELAMLQKRFAAPWRPDSDVIADEGQIPNEIVGYPLTPRLRQELEVLLPEQFKWTDDRNTLVICNKRESGCDQLWARVRQINPQTRVEVLEDHLPWLEEVYKRLIPLKTINYLVQWLNTIHP
jgi:alpha/beta superfamily hydrolase